MIQRLKNILYAIRLIPRRTKRSLFFAFDKAWLVVLVTLYGLYLVMRLFLNIPLIGFVFIPVFSKPSKSIYNFLSKLKVTNAGISAVSLIELGAKNITFKKTRSFITIGGMAIGIGSIVFLVSLGYGAQRMVVGRVARLDELKQADIATQPGSKVVINDDQLSKIKGFQEVLAVLPLISVVGRVNYQNSSTDMAVYGVTTQYLSESAEKPVRGNVFSSNETANIQPATPADLGEVSGVTSKRVSGQINDELGIANYNIVPDKWIRIRKSPDKNAEIVGYARRFAGQSVGKLIIGSTYSDTEFGNVESTNEKGEVETVGKWIMDDFALWEQVDCDPANTDCDLSGKYRQKKDADGAQLIQSGYTAMVNISIYNLPVKESEGLVLGIEDNTLDQTSDAEKETTSRPSSSATTVETIDISDIKASGSAMMALTEIASESAKTVAAVKQVEVSKKAKREAVVNRAMLTVLGINEEVAIGKEFDVSFVVTGDLLGVDSSKIESVPSKYRIVGIVPQNTTPFFYVPFVDLRGLGIENFSQAKLVAKSQNELARARQLTEALGFNTTSAVDTVEQIDRLFGTIRLVLVSLGIVALGVAAMGMFNTLTVSLLERTHEVGLMKTMGMKSEEIENLFLIESVVMGLFGGIAGILFGFSMGKLLSLTLTVMAIKSGAGVIDISYVPLSFVTGIMALSLIVGLATGVYPAFRARRISALNALRYE